MYVFANFQMMCLGQLGASGEALLALNHTGVIGEMEHPQKYLSEAKDTSGNPRTFVLQSVVASPPHPASTLVRLPGRCWDKGHLAGSGSGPPGAQQGPAAGQCPHSTLQRRGGLCPGAEAGAHLPGALIVAMLCFPLACLFSRQKSRVRGSVCPASFGHSTYLRCGFTAGWVSDLNSHLFEILHRWPLVHRVKA